MLLAAVRWRRLHPCPLPIGPQSSRQESQLDGARRASAPEAGGLRVGGRVSAAVLRRVDTV
jgi:hypothetical protein